MLRQVRCACSVLPCEAYRLKRTSLWFTYWSIYGGLKGNCFLSSFVIKIYTYIYTCRLHVRIFFESIVFEYVTHSETHYCLVYIGEILFFQTDFARFTAMLQSPGKKIVRHRKVKDHKKVNRTLNFYFQTSDRSRVFCKITKNLG